MLDLDLAIKEAMRARSTALLTGYRSLKSKVLLKRSEAGRDREQPLSEEEFLQLLRREIKEREESNEYLQPGNPAYEENAAIVSDLGTHLPKQPSAEELDGLIQKIIAETGASSPRDMGKVMAALKAANPALAMKTASERVKALLQG